MASKWKLINKFKWAKDKGLKCEWKESLKTFVWVCSLWL